VSLSVCYNVSSENLKKSFLSDPDIHIQKTKVTEIYLHLTRAPDTSKNKIIALIVCDYLAENINKPRPAKFYRSQIYLQFTLDKVLKLLKAYDVK